MIDLAKAKILVKDFVNKKWGAVYGKEYVIEEDKIVDYNTAWYVTFTEKSNGDFWIGVKKGVIVDKFSGEIFQPGSAYPIEDWIWGFNLGLRGKPVDLIINKVNSYKLGVDQLGELGLLHDNSYLLNTKERLIKRFDREEIIQRLTDIPCKFSCQNLTIKIWVFKEIVKSEAFEFQIKPSNC